MTEVKNIDTLEFRNTACVVYPAEYPSGKAGCSAPEVEDLHSTILFLGDIDEDLGGVLLDSLAALLKDVDYNHYQYVAVEGTALFGPDKNIPVLKLELTPIMQSIRTMTEWSLNVAGIVSPSMFGYSPHVTIDAHSYKINNIPEWVLLGPAQLWYQDQKVELR